MQLDSDDLLAQIRHDWPEQYELSELRLLVQRQAEQIERLTQAAAQQPATFTGSASLPYTPGVGDGTRLDLEPRHG